jgi:hypothetical protein
MLPTLRYSRRSRRTPVMQNAKKASYAFSMAKRGTTRTKAAQLKCQFAGFLWVLSGSLVPSQARDCPHNPKVVSSNLPPATNSM